MRIGGRRTTCRSEEGTTTPFDMVMLNNLDASASSHTREYGEDDPEITNWTWPAGSDEPTAVSRRQIQ